MLQFSNTHGSSIAKEFEHMEFSILASFFTQKKQVVSMLISWLIALLVIKVKTASSMTSAKYAGLNGVQLKFAVTNFPPFDVITLKLNGNLTHTGSNPPFYQWLSKRLDFTISYVILNETAAAKSGSSTKLILHLLEKKEVDAATMGFIATPERKEKMDLAYFMWTEPHTMVVPQPEEEPRLFAFIRPFKHQVWILILMTMIAMAGLMALLSKIYSSGIHTAYDQTLKKRTSIEYVSRYFLDVIKILTNQGGTQYGRRFPFRILVGVWILVATVIVNCYSGTVISYLTVSKKKPLINSFEDLAASSEISVIVRDDFVIGQQIMGAKMGILKVLGDQVRQNPKHLVHKSSEIIALLRTGHYAFPFLNSACTSFVANEFKLDRECRFTTSDPLSMYGYWAMPLQKNSKFTTMFNDALIGLWESGLPWFWVKINTPQAPQCFTSKIKGRTSSTRQVPIQLNDLLGAFLVLGVGIMLSTIAFMLESTIKF